MPTVHVIHGFNVRDNGRNTTDKLLPYFRQRGYLAMDHDYGWVGPIRLRRRNARSVEEILPWIAPGDILVGHSNGCLLCWKLIEAGAPAAKVVCIQPAMKKGTVWSKSVQVLCLFNDKDRVMYLSYAWSRLTSFINIFREPHDWGYAGKVGFTEAENVLNINTRKAVNPAKGHSGLFRPFSLAFWSHVILTWIDGGINEETNLRDPAVYGLLRKYDRRLQREVADD